MPLDIQGAGIGGDLGGGIGGALGGAIGMLFAGKGGAKYYKQAVDTWRKLQEPDFDFRELSAPELQIFAEIAPELYEAYVPQEAKLINDSPELRAAQQRGLARMEETATTGETTQDKVERERISDQAGRDRQRMDLAILNNLRQRGQAGSGAEILLRELGASSAAQQEHDMQSQLAAAGADRRLQANQMAGQFAGQMRGQDIDLAGQNAQITNRFNEMIADARNRAAEYAAGERARAQTANAQQRQRIGEENTLNRFRTQEGNLNRRNELQQSLFGARLAKTSGLSNALTGYGNVKELERMRRIQLGADIGQGIGKTAGAAYGGGLI